MESVTSPFNQDSDNLFNLVTKVVMPENVKKGICEQSTIGFCQRVDPRKKNQFLGPNEETKLLTRKTKGKKSNLGRQQLHGAARRQETVCKNDGCLQESTGY